MSRLLALLGSSAVVVAAVACSVEEPPAPSSDDAITESDASTTMPESKVDGGAGDDPSSADAAKAETQTSCDDASFSKKVLPEIAKAGCAGVACHGTRFGHDPRLEAKDAPLTYTALTAYKISGKPYVVAGGTDPADSAIHCHLLGQCGTKMPPGGGKVPDAMLQAIDDWLACGAPNN